MSSRTRLRMDREPTSTKFTDPSHPAGKRREIDNVMKKARAGTNDYWDKKLLEVEEKDPNRWRHTGFKKMYIEGDENSSSGGESDRESNYRYKRSNGREREEVYRRQSRSRSRSGPRKSPPTPPPQARRRSPHRVQPRSPGRIARRSPEASRKMYRMQHSPPSRTNRPSRSPVPRGRRSPPSPPMRRRSPDPPSAPPSRKHGAPILPRSKRPPSPPRHTHARMPSESSGSSCTDESCSVCSPSHHRRNKSRSVSRPRRGPHSPPVASKRTSRMKHRNEKSTRVRPSASPAVRPSKVVERVHREPDARDRMVRPSNNRPNRVRGDSSPPEDPRLRTRPPEPPEEPQVKKKKAKEPVDKSKGKHKKLRRIKIEGEKRTTKKPGSSSESNDSDSDSEEGSPISTFTATTRLTLSERFGKMAQWSMDRSNMENMRITKDSAGGALKVMIEEGLDSHSSALRGNSSLSQGGAGRRFSYSPAPVGHFPEELSTTAPSGIISWDDVRVRYEYYKSCGYLRDLNVEDYVKWEEWWYKYQDWLKQERYYEYIERQQMQRRYRKKVPITQRLN